MAESIVTLSADDTALLRSWQKQQAAQEKTDEGYKSNEKASKKAADQAIRDAELIERESRRNAQAMFREHHKLLAERELESRMAAQKQEALARQTAFAEVKAAIKAAEQQIDAIEKVAAEKRRVAQQSNAMAASTNELASASANAIAGIATGYVSIGTAISAATEIQSRFIERQEKSAELFTQIAGAQQEASKNLPGDSTQQLDKKLTQQVPAIAIEANFSDLDILTKTLAATSSITSPDLAKGLTVAAAKINRFDKADTERTAMAFGDIANASTIGDAEKVAALTVSSAAISRPANLAQFASGLAPVIDSAVQSSPKSDPVEVTKQAAALYAFTGKLDPTGQVSSNSTLIFAKALGGLFHPMQKDARERDEEIARLLEKQAVTPLEQANIDRTAFTLKEKSTVAARIKPDDTSKFALDARIDLSEATAAYNHAKNNAGLDATEAAKLNRLTIERDATQNDPGLPLERIKAIARNPVLKEAFLGNLGGDEKMKTRLQSLLDNGGNAFDELLQNVSAVNVDATSFKNLEANQLATPQQRNAFTQEKSDTRRNVDRLLDVSGANRSRAAKLEADALAQTDRGFIDGVVTSLGGFTSAVQRTFANDDDFFARRVDVLGDRRKKLSLESPSEERDRKLNILDTNIQSIQDLASEVAQSRKLAEEANQLMKEQNDLLRQGNKKVDDQTNVFRESGDPSRSGAIRAQVARAKD
jgi:hypothetical protein